MIRLSLTLFISSTNLFYGLLFANSIVLYLVRPGRRAEELSFTAAAQNGGAARSAYKKPPLSREIAERRLAS